jgi:hypothetical protein
LNTAQEGERRANGFDYKAQQATDTKDEEAERERNQRKKLLASLSESLNAFKGIPVKTMESA